MSFPQLRIGLGLDVHPFSSVEQRPLVLAGVHLEGERGLVGHSDADVVAHAVADALLGAAGLGDLGRHFPDDSPQHLGADSLAILASVKEMVEAKGWRLVNADCTVVAQTPRLSPYLDAMSANLSTLIGAPISLKAASPELLGALGRSEGIACMAVALLVADER
ncbi:MAG: 2-C-methyl-D-erythritol 2,4-cyclodiphosphate synthase [Actinobacteria bacterium]|nr:2-C-methyl-D-erythritol 2,4-cyclodiphosphate synthase [Actinomycetota bacterium]